MAHAKAWSDLVLKEIQDRSKSLGMNLKELCEKGGISHLPFWRWTSGRGKPRVDFLDDVFAILDKIEKRRK